jgi:flagellar biosynthesis/type III secretory pathway protein FliH
MQVQRFDYKEFSSSEVNFDKKPAEPSVFRKSQWLKNQQEEQQRQAAAIADVPPPPPEAPTFSEEDVKAAEMKGYQRGFQEGNEDGKRQLDAEREAMEKQMLAHVESFAKAIAPLFDDYRKIAVELRKQMPQVALAIARKVTAETLDEKADAIVSKMVLAACESMISEPKLTITVHESMGDLLAKQLEILTNRLNANNEIIILRSPDMPLSDYKLEWKNGAMERSVSHIWEQIERATENLVVSAARDTNAHLDQLQTQVVADETPNETPKEHKE